MREKVRILVCVTTISVLFLSGFISSNVSARKDTPLQVSPAQITPYDLIAAMNTLRMANGLQALVEDPIINAVAQNTAQIMADQNLSWHIGDVKGRLAAAGYGNGGTVWATENFAVGQSLSIDEIMSMWSDESHMIPAVKPYYCNIGAGIAKAANGSTYYILQAAYVSGKECGSYTSTDEPGVPTTPTANIGFGYIVPVTLSTPDATGQVIHEVKAGQSFWMIAVAYQVKIADIQKWNNLPEGYTLQIGQKIIIPSANSPGYQTPTPMGFFTATTPDADGRIEHTVQAYQNLSMISTAYGVQIEKILEYNPGLKIDTPLQIGQILIIAPGNATPSPTTRPLTAIEQLTPANNGNYYHMVLPGQNLTWIAEYYDISLSDLRAWNNLTTTDVVWVGQLLLLKVTPPPSNTPTLLPSPPTPSPTFTLPIKTPSSTSQPSPRPVVTITAPPSPEPTHSLWLIPVGLVAAISVYWLVRKGKKEINADTVGSNSDDNEE